VTSTPSTTTIITTTLKMVTKTVGDSHRGPLKTGENPFSFVKKQNTNEFANQKHAQNNQGPVAGAHGLGGPSGPPEQLAQPPSGETPLRSRGTAPH
jgi:hypothetical protein